MIERDENGKLVWKPDRSVRPAPVKRTPSLRLVDMRKKLLEKQKEGKKKMRNLGTVQVPTEAFMAVLKLDSD